MKTRGLLAAGLLAAVAAGQQDRPVGIPIAGQVRTLPECRTLDGESLDWTELEGRSLVLLFHRPGLEYSTKGLRAVIDLMAAEPEVARGSALVVVGFVEEGLDVAAREADVPGLQTRVVLDPGLRAFAEYRAVAFPTAYVLDAERREIHVGRGFGPHFGFRVEAALRYALGLVDEAGFRELMAGDAEVERTPEERREIRVCGLARAMARRGELEAARQLVEDLLVENETPGIQAWELAVRLRLASGDAAGARRALERLEESEAVAPLVSLLRCRLRLHAGEFDSAEKELAGVRARLHPEAYLLRGRILEARGQVEEAAALYRERLERAVFSSE